MSALQERSRRGGAGRLSVCEFGVIQAGDAFTTSDKKVQVETKLPQSQHRPQ